MGILQDIEHAPATVVNAVSNYLSPPKSFSPAQEGPVGTHNGALPPGVSGQPSYFGNPQQTAQANAEIAAQTTSSPQIAIASQPVAPPPELMKLALAAPVNVHGPSYALGLKAGHEAAYAANPQVNPQGITDPVNFGLAGSMDPRNQPQVE